MDLKKFRVCKLDYPLDQYKHIRTGSTVKTCADCRKKIRKHVDEYLEREDPEIKRVRAIRRKAHSKALTNLKHDFESEFNRLFTLTSKNLSGKSKTKRNDYIRTYMNTAYRLKKEHLGEFLVHFEAELEKVGIENNNGRISP